MSPIEIEVLGRLESGLIRLTPDDGIEIIRWNRWFELKKHIHYSGRARYKFCNTYIYANRLIFMLKRKQAIPEGFFIDHKNGDKTNDSFENLQLHRSSQSHSQGINKAIENRFEKLCRWFELVGRLGREPSQPCELTYLDIGF